MDTSKEYIKMCEKAVEIQELRPTVLKGDLSVKDFFKQHNNGFDKSIWLPRQDQLQEMAGCSWDEFYHGVIIGWSDCEEKQDSMEKACLLSLMFEKFDKVWNGTDWEEK